MLTKRRASKVDQRAREVTEAARLNAEVARQRAAGYSGGPGGPRTEPGPF